MFRRVIVGIALAAVIGIIAVERFVPPFAQVSTGITAKQICSLTFVSGFEPGRAWDLYLEPILRPYARAIDYAVDENAQEVTATMFGFGWKSRAVFREGLGCTLVFGDADGFDRELAMPQAAPIPMSLNAEQRSAYFDETALAAAIDAAFSAPGASTLAVVVLHKGELIAEQYAEGVGPETPLHGWSMSKSIAATAAGALVRRGLLDISAQGRIPAFDDAGKDDITIEQLLRMQAGIAAFERNDGFDPNSDMLFTESDMAKFAATRDRVAEPGTTWDYQSGQTILAGTGFQPVIGSSVDDQISTIRELLFAPLGVNTAIVEADQSGNLVWSSYIFASARDWARLGQLYLNDGRAPDGSVILSDEWVDLVRQPTEGSGGRYGMGFWLFDSTPENGALQMNGFQGQYAFILPERDLVIVRLGADSGWTDAPFVLARNVQAAMLPGAGDAAVTNTEE